MCEAYEAVGDIHYYHGSVTLTRASPLAAWASPSGRCLVVHEDRSRLFVSATLRLAGTRLHSAPLTDSPLLFRSCHVDRMTPLVCCDAPAPAADSARSSHHASHRVRRCGWDTCITLGDSLAQRIRGSDSPLIRFVTFAP
jgi:hypothetical protein